MEIWKLKKMNFFSKNKKSPTLVAINDIFKYCARQQPIYKREKGQTYKFAKFNNI